MGGSCSRVSPHYPAQATAAQWRPAAVVVVQVRRARLLPSGPSTGMACLTGAVLTLVATARPASTPSAFARKVPVACCSGGTLPDVHGRAQRRPVQEPGRRARSRGQRGEVTDATRVLPERALNGLPHACSAAGAAGRGCPHRVARRQHLVQVKGGVGGRCYGGVVWRTAKVPACPQRSVRAVIGHGRAMPRTRAPATAARC